MPSIKNLRILLILNMLTVIVGAILGLYYDTNVSPLIDQADQINLESMSNLNASLFVISLSLARILATLRGEALTISEVARRLALSRQAVHKTITRLVQRELLRLEWFPGNARDKRIEFTEKGEAMKLAASCALHEIEQEIESSIGKENFKLLKGILNQPW